MAKKEKKNTFSYILAALIVSAIITACLNPVLRLVYPMDYQKIIEDNADKYGLDKFLVAGIISAESGFDKNAKSHKDAIGLMQIKEDTALWCLENLNIEVADKDLDNPQTNIAIGCAYFDYLLSHYEGNIKTAVAAYNAGLGNVDKWLSDGRYSTGKDTNLISIPFGETKDYLDKVLKRAKIYKKLYK